MNSFEGSVLSFGSLFGRSMVGSAVLGLAAVTARLLASQAAELGALKGNEAELQQKLALIEALTRQSAEVACDAQEAPGAAPHSEPCSSRAPLQAPRVGLRNCDPEGRVPVGRRRNLGTTARSASAARPRCGEAARCRSRASGPRHRERKVHRAIVDPSSLLSLTRPRASGRPRRERASAARPARSPR
jgi:hypothetical protein